MIGLHEYDGDNKDDGSVKWHLPDNLTMWDKKHFDWDCSHDNSHDNWRDYYDVDCDDSDDDDNTDDDDNDESHDDSEYDDNGGDDDENQDILGFIFCSVASNRLDKQWLGRSPRTNLVRNTHRCLGKKGKF